MDIKQTFLNLTSRTYPHGTEHLLEEFLPDDIKQDRFGNYFYQIGDDSRVIFTSHLDTVSGEYKDIIHTFDKHKKIVGTDGTTTLGADDKAGVTIMLYMIENKIPGLYYFFIGEEVGCIGSNKVSSQTQIFNKHNYDKVISFDRRGNTSVITHQSKLRSCSDEFAENLCNELNSYGLGMETDETGVCTDSLEFINDIPECTNISVGYLDEHTFDETQDLEFLVRISKACVKVDWEKLPVKRDPYIIEKRKKKNNYNGKNSCPRSSRIRNHNHNHNFKKIPNWNNEMELSCAYHNPFDDPRINSELGPFPEDSPTFHHRGTLIAGDVSTGDRFFDDDDHIDIYDKNGNVINRNNSLNSHRNVYFDNIDSDAKIISDSNAEDEKMKLNYFKSVKRKYLNDMITKKEMKIVKEQLL